MTTAPAHVQVRLPPQSRSRTAVGGRPRPWWLVPVGAYVVSRLLVGLGVLFAYVAYPSRAPSYFLHRWDSAWYLAIARHGYPAHLHYPVGLHGAPPRYSPWAFFPLFPLLVRAVHAVTALGYTISAYALNVVIAGLAVLVLWRLAQAVAGSEAADRTVLLFCAFPGSVVLSLAYSEALFILLVTLTLLLLVRHRWWLAGLTGALCSLTRPTGVSIVVAAAVAALVAVLRRRDWSALSAPLLGGLGAAAFLAFAWGRTGSPFIWRQAELLWHQGVDFGVGTARLVEREADARGSAGPALVLLLLSLAWVLMALVVLGRDRFRLPAPLLAYTFVALAADLVDSHVGTRPRFVISVVPLFIAVARRLRGYAFLLVLTSCVALLPLTAFLYVGGTKTIP
ncbi:MAG: mannosyltransferase family protein [Actinomycetes bacterium]